MAVDAMALFIDLLFVVVRNFRCRCRSAFSFNSFSDGLEICKVWLRSTKTPVCGPSASASIKEHATATVLDVDPVTTNYEGKQSKSMAKALDSGCMRCRILFNVSHFKHYTYHCVFFVKKNVC